MRVETTKKIILTKAEQKTLRELFAILDEDNSLTLSDCWEILQNIALNKNALEYGYYIDTFD